MRGDLTLMFLSLSFSLPSPLSKIKYLKKKKRKKMTQRLGLLPLWSQPSKEHISCAKVTGKVSRPRSPTLPLTAGTLLKSA